jgi:FtsP/CotA-like multicopper oxidase with cupredoxin domain
MTTPSTTRHPRARVALVAHAVLAILTLAIVGCRSQRGEVEEFEIVAAPARLPLVDGRDLEVWAYNGQVPGPTLRVRLGDTLRMKFTNRLPQPTTVHWHGVRVPNGMDGVPGVTQAPIEPGESFVYEFAPKDAGTYWFHPHIRSSEQVERGLFGVLIVEDAEPPPFSRDELWVLDDLLLGRDGQIAPQFNTRHDLAHDGRWGNAVVVNGKRRPELHVRPGERLRLRLLNVANGRVFLPDFAPLEAKIIAVDGRYTSAPIEGARFELAPGNRIDLDVVVPESLAGKRVTVRDRFPRRPIDLAEIVVSGEPVETPRFTVPVEAPLVEDAASESTAEPPLELRLNAQQGGPFGIAWTINGKAMAHADGHHASDERYALRLNQKRRLRFVNDSYRLHPMHLHGMFFHVVARNGVAVHEPFSRDTVLVHPRETVEVVAMPADPGLWMAHCHILEHAEAGMMTLIDVR